MQFRVNRVVNAEGKLRDAIFIDRNVIADRTTILQFRVRTGYAKFFKDDEIYIAGVNGLVEYLCRQHPSFERDLWAVYGNAQTNLVAGDPDAARHIHWRYGNAFRKLFVDDEILDDVYDYVAGLKTTTKHPSSDTLIVFTLLVRLLVPLLATCTLTDDSRSLVEPLFLIPRLQPIQAQIWAMATMVAAKEPVADRTGAHVRFICAEALYKELLVARIPAVFNLHDVLCEALITTVGDVRVGSFNKTKKSR